MGSSGYFKHVFIDSLGSRWIFGILGHLKDLFVNSEGYF